MRIKIAEFFKSAIKPGDYPRDNFPQIAFAGRSNVGKSSLINSLVNRKGLARTSRTPGRTQLINFFTINRSFYFVDLPGYGYAKVPLKIRENWGNMIETYLKKSKTLRLLVFILDARRLPSPLDKQLLNWLFAYEIPFLFVVTKTDKLSKSALQRQLKIIKEKIGAPKGADFLPFSAKTRKGTRELLDVIGDVVEPQKDASSEK